MAIDKFGVRWGQPGAPLLPATLRRLWSDERIPSWMAKDLRLGRGATYGELDSSATQVGVKIPGRVVRALSSLLGSRRESVRTVQCIEQPWPSGLAPDAVPWTVRTRNALWKCGVLLPDGPDIRKTIGELFAVEGAGVVTVLDFAATLESSIDHFKSSTSMAVGAIAEATSECDNGTSTLATVLGEPWARQIGGTDPRFPELRRFDGSLHDFAQSVLESPELPGRADRLAQAIAKLPEIRRKVVQIANGSLEQQLRGLLEVLRPMDIARTNAICDRLGWSGGRPKTLQEAADAIGLTRERIRQIESKILKSVPTEFPIFLPALDKAIAELRRVSPISIDDAAKLIRRSEISERPFQPEALIAAANHLGRDHGLAISIVRGKAFVIAEGAEESVRTVARLVRQLSGMSGAFSVFQLQRECLRAGSSFDAARLRPLLPSIPNLVQLDNDGDWWRVTGIPAHRDRLLNLIIKMLSVVSPQSVRSLRDGISRVYRWRSSTVTRYRDNLIVPPVGVIEAILEGAREIVLHDDLASLQHPVDYRNFVGETERIFVDVLRSSSTGMMDRLTMARQCMSRGMNEATFGTLTSYSPLLEHPAPGVWKLRGVVVAPAAVEALRQSLKGVARGRRVLNYGWSREGRIWIAVRVPEFASSMVVGIPGPLAGMLGGRTFTASFSDGLACGTIASRKKVDGADSMWGFASFIRMAALDEGDVFRMTFDLGTASAVLEQVDENSLDD